MSKVTSIQSSKSAAVASGVGLINNRRIGWADGLGIFLSFLCLVHCIFLPLALLIYPSLAVFLSFDDEVIHRLLLFLLVPPVLFAGYSGFRLHGRREPLVYLAVGFLGIFLSALEWVHSFSHTLEYVLVVAGSILLVWGHFLNSKNCYKHHTENRAIEVG